MPKPGAALSNRFRHLFGYLLLGGWLMSMGWAFWLIEGQAAHARAQLASDPLRVASIEAWGAAQGAGRIQRPLLILLPSPCACASHAGVLERLHGLAEAAGVGAARFTRGAAPSVPLPSATGAALFNAEGRLLFAGPLESPLHCSDGRSLVELVLPHAADDAPPLWAPVIDEPCACDGHYLSTRAPTDAHEYNTA
ncbi:DUF6436 domain-containing protein [Aquimonas voraii]|uniref:DUF6436 domain-containing protein n=1 Tax=Aquimonas voraii TaxID=265719 RepID=A0A1G6ST21_9GAMM|nr:DUF6436 domain-containing protein [Aquimonas voraii]SDD19275.1 hypothetical protein SAMN04488509_101644 [Aquimonas voraii]